MHFLDGFPDTWFAEAIGTRPVSSSTTSLHTKLCRAWRKEAILHSASVKWKRLKTSLSLERHSDQKNLWTSISAKMGCVDLWLIVQDGSHEIQVESFYHVVMPQVLRAVRRLMSLYSCLHNQGKAAGQKLSLRPFIRWCHFAQQKSRDVWYYSNEIGLPSVVKTWLYKT